MPFSSSFSYRLQIGIIINQDDPLQGGSGRQGLVAIDRTLPFAVRAAIDRISLGVNVELPLGFKQAKPSLLVVASRKSAIGP